MAIELWRRVLRDGVLPLLTDNDLAEMTALVERDDPRLIQGATTLPQEWDGETAECGCFIALVGMRKGIESVGQVDRFFEGFCAAAGRALGDLSAIRHFLNWHDTAERDEFLRELLAELHGEAARRWSQESAAWPQYVLPTWAAEGVA